MVSLIQNQSSKNKAGRAVRGRMWPSLGRVTVLCLSLWSIQASAVQTRYLLVNGVQFELTLPDPEISLSGSVVLPYGINLTWTPVQSVHNYKLEWIPDGQTSWQTLYTGYTLQYDMPSPNPVGEHEFRVSACTNGVCDVISGAATVTVNLLLDSDNDGVFDYADQCPNTASGAPVNVSGCAPAQRDSDEDGVTDDLDDYPWQSDLMCTP